MRAASLRRPDPVEGTMSETRNKEALKQPTRELTPEEITQVTGGAIDVCSIIEARVSEKVFSIIEAHNPNCKV